MAVIVSKENGNKRYRVLGADNAYESDEELRKADKLDIITEKEIERLIKKVYDLYSINGIIKPGIDVYWTVGNTLAKIADNTDLLNPVERPLYWLNVKMYLPEELLKQDRSIHRVHLEYCYRLGKYPLNMAKKLNWGEWVYLYDSPTINSEYRFDMWFLDQLKLTRQRFDRKFIRFFVQMLNTLIGSVDTSAMSDVELFACYETSILIQNIAKNNNMDVYIKETINSIKEEIKKNAAKLSNVMDGKISPHDYATMLIENITD